MNQHKPLAALEIRGLQKNFDRPAVDGLDLVVRAGEFYSLLGPNGAGKTTTLRMVAGLLRPDAGTIEIAGIDALADPVSAKQVMAWVSDEPMIYDKLTPKAAARGRRWRSPGRWCTTRALSSSMNRSPARCRIGAAKYRGRARGSETRITAARSRTAGTTTGPGSTTAARGKRGDADQRATATTDGARAAAAPEEGQRSDRPGGGVKTVLRERSPRAARSLRIMTGRRNRLLEVAERMKARSDPAGRRPAPDGHADAAGEDAHQRNASAGRRGQSEGRDGRPQHRG